MFADCTCVRPVDHDINVGGFTGTVEDVPGVLEQDDGEVDYA